MLHALINDNKEIVQFPFTDAEIRATHPDVSFPTGPLDYVDMTHLNIIAVEPTRMADMAPLEDGNKYQLTGAVWNDDGTKLIRTYTQVPATPDAA